MGQADRAALAEVVRAVRRRFAEELELEQRPALVAVAMECPECGVAVLVAADPDVEPVRPAPGAEHGQAM
jgi:hypothetical protein